MTKQYYMYNVMHCINNKKNILTAYNKALTYVIIKI